MAHGVSKPAWPPPTVFYLKNIKNIKFIDIMVDSSPYMIDRCEARQVKS
jgi:hypothetical protein